MAVRRRSSRQTTRRRVSKRRAVRRRVVARKAKKAKRVSIIGTKRQVWNGSRSKTTGGLVKSDLCVSKSGKIVSKKMASRGKKMMKKSSGLSKWIAAVKQVRKEMNLKGFVAIKKGTPYYKRVKAIYDA